ncbi:unnamed protein product [Schistocephalus solidus]|uniref:Uncharacterized protein n=1 Tax=Schistocephalus solidus TaxID=70667 RepID=A0A183TJP0_SCHSO|nr:unnamed protein product [Schistocephalus solidus]
MYISSPGLAFNPKWGKASDLLAFDFFNGTDSRTKATKDEHGKFWRKPATWNIETVNHTAPLHTRLTLDALSRHSRSRRFTPLPSARIAAKRVEAREYCREITQTLRSRAHTLLKKATFTRSRLVSLASWLISPAVQSGNKSSTEHKTRNFLQTIFNALNNVVNTTYNVVAVERRKNAAAKSAKGIHRPALWKGGGRQPKFPNSTWSTSWTRRHKDTFEVHINTRAELSGLLYELRRDRRVAVLDFYRTVQRRLNWSEERQKVWLMNGTLPALIDELHAPSLKGRDFADENLYSARHFLRSFIRLSTDRTKLPIGEAFSALVNRTMTTIEEGMVPTVDREFYRPKCEFTDYGD